REWCKARARDTRQDRAEACACSCEDSFEPGGNGQLKWGSGADLECFNVSASGQAGCGALGKEGPQRQPCMSLKMRKFKLRTGALLDRRFADAQILARLNM